MVFSSNIWCCVGGEAKIRPASSPKNPQPSLLSFAEWQERGNGVGDVLADPHFADPSARDFRFTSASAAVLDRVGFKPFDFTCAGIEKKGK